MKPRRAIGVSDMGCNKIEPDSIEDGIIKTVNQRKRATTPAGKAVIGLGYLRTDPNFITAKKFIFDLFQKQY